MRLLPLSLILIIIHLVGCRSIQVDEDVDNVDKNQFEIEFLYPVNNKNDIDHDNQKINQELIETSSVRGGSIDDKTQPPPNMVLRASTMNQTFFKVNLYFPKSKLGIISATNTNRPPITAFSVGTSPKNIKPIINTNIISESSTKLAF